MGLATLWKVLGRSVLLPGAQVMVHGVASGSIPSPTQEAVTEATLMDAPNEALPRIIHYFFRMELLFCRRADSVFIKPHCVRFTQLRKGLEAREKVQGRSASGITDSRTRQDSAQPQAQRDAYILLPRQSSHAEGGPALCQWKGSFRCPG